MFWNKNKTRLESEINDFSFTSFILKKLGQFYWKMSFKFMKNLILENSYFETYI